MNIVSKLYSGGSSLFNAMGAGTSGLATQAGTALATKFGDDVRNGINDMGTTAALNDKISLARKSAKDQTQLDDAHQNAKDEIAMNKAANLNLEALNQIQTKAASDMVQNAKT